MKRTEIRRKVGELLGYRVECSSPQYYRLVGPGDVHLLGWWHSEAKVWGQLPHFDEDIAEAWRVVEFMTRIPTTQEEAERACNTKFGYAFDNAAMWACSAEEAALEICLLALRASGVEVGSVEEDGSDGIPR